MNTNLNGLTFKKVVTEEGEFETNEDKQLLNSYFKSSPWDIDLSRNSPTGIKHSNKGYYIIVLKDNKVSLMKSNEVHFENSPGISSSIQSIFRAITLLCGENVQKV